MINNFYMYDTFFRLWMFCRQFWKINILYLWFLCIYIFWKVYFHKIKENHFSLQHIYSIYLLYIRKYDLVQTFCWIYMLYLFHDAFGIVCNSQFFLTFQFWPCATILEKMFTWHIESLIYTRWKPWKLCK